MSLYYITLPLLAFGLAWIFIAIALRTPLADHFADIPDQRKLHEAPVPRIGGICIIVAFTVVLHFWYTLSPGFAFLHQDLYYSILACVIVVLFVGFLDDSTFVAVRVRHKLFAEFALAIGAVIMLHLHFGHITLFHDLKLPFWLSDLIAVFWIVGVINALNIIDGVNGLAGGVAIIAFAAIAILGQQIDSERVTLLALILLAATAGFLAHNLRPSRVFLGDTGSLFLGAMLGIISLHLINLSDAGLNLPICALIIGLPILDVFIAMVRRYFKARDRRQPLHKCLHATIVPDNNHIHHRLITRGYSHMQTSLLLYAFSGMLCIGAFTMQYLDTKLKYALATYLLLAASIVLRRLGFGSRFFKFLRRLKRNFVNPQRLDTRVIGIVDTHGVLFHACREAAPPHLRFERVNLLHQTSFDRPLSGMVIYNAPQTSLAQDLALARAFYRDSGNPVFLVTDKVASNIAISGSDEIFCKKMPVNIRSFLAEIHEVVAVERRSEKPAQKLHPVYSMETEQHGIAS